MGSSAQNGQSISNQNKPIVFLGDNLTYHWKDHGKEAWAQFYAPLQAVNHAKLNESTEMLIERLENEEIHLEGVRAAVLMIGATDLRKRLKPIIVSEQIKTIVELLRENCPRMKVLVLGVIPREWDNHLNKSVQEINEQLYDIDNDCTVRYLDMWDNFADKKTGKVIPELYDENGLNLLPKGYQVWANAMAHVFDVITRNR